MPPTQIRDNRTNVRRGWSSDFTRGVVVVVVDRACSLRTEWRETGWGHRSVRCNVEPSMRRYTIPSVSSTRVEDASPTQLEDLVCSDILDITDTSMKIDSTVRGTPCASRGRTKGTLRLRRRFFRCCRRSRRCVFFREPLLLPPSWLLVSPATAGPYRCSTRTPTCNSVVDGAVYSTTNR